MNARQDETLGHRIGLVGLGSIVMFGQMPSYRSAGVEVVAAADISASAVTVFQTAFGDVPHVTTDVQSVITDENVDVIDIATPPATHLELIRAAIDAGKHVMCQKPLTLSLDEAREAICYADEHDLQLAVNQNVRYMPANQAIAAWLNNSCIGAPHLATIEYHAAIAYEPWRAALKHMIFTDAMLHHMDLIRWWFGMPATIFAAETRLPSSCDSAATIGSMVATYSSGLIVNLICDWINPGNEPSFTIRIDGDRGSIRSDGKVARCFTARRRKTWTETVPEAGDLWLPGIGFLPAFSACIQGFLSALDSGAEAPTSGRDNLGTLEMLFAVHESVESGHVVQPSGVS